MAVSTRQRNRRARSRHTRRRGTRSRTARRRFGLRRPRRRSGGLWRSVVADRGFALSNTQREVLGLALVALGVFMAFVLYGGWDGGGVGHGLAVGFGFVVGRARWLAPPALVAIGAVMLLRPAFPALRPLRAGAFCLFAAVVLALAQGTLGISSGQASTHAAHLHGVTSHWSGAYLEERGGAAGQALWSATHALVQEVGVEILVAFLALAALSLLTGSSLASIMRTAGRGALAVLRLPLLAVRGALHWLGYGLPEEAGDGFQEDARDALQFDFAGAVEHAVAEDAHISASRATDASLFNEDVPHDPDHAPAASDAPEAAAEGGEEGGVWAAEPDGKEQAPAPSRRASKAAPAEEELTPQGRLRDVVTDDPEFAWEVPQPTKMLTRSNATSEEGRQADAGQQERIANVLLEALGHFGVEAKVIGTVTGPHITRYELRLAPGTKVAKVAQLKDDLAYALAATDIRILAPIPGKQAVGVEVPNARRRIVRLGDVFQEPPRDWSPLTVWLGKDVAGKAIGADLARMPHLLVAGATGSGKSGAINAMLSSVLLRASPHEARLVLVDPKQVELNHYESIPHLLTPVITNPRMAANALANLVREMEQRYGIMSLARTRSLPELNTARRRRGEPPLPYILCVIDELADLMMVAPADVEDSIIRLAQKARAVGIHLVLATQSPRVDVITGMIKANVPSRIAFAVSSQTDSRVILDQNGAETLLGQGDLLFSPMGSAKLQRIQGAYIDEAQIAKITDFWRRQGEPELREELLEQVEPADERSGDELHPDQDPLLREAITLVAEMQTASTSMMQRRLRVGYTRAGRLIDMLERRGVISGYEGSKPRQVLISEADLPRVLATLGEEESAESSAGADPQGAKVAEAISAGAAGGGASSP
jgi:S-DNA-T family DNA segregation ATPase FtsK/SpoIIIE